MQRQFYHPYTSDTIFLVPKIKFPNNILWPIVILVIALSTFYFKPWQTKPAETISVTAEGKADATPNVAQITATVESRNSNLDAARAQNEKKVTEIINRLKEIGVDEKDIQTQQISGSPISFNLFIISVTF